jgi:type II secretory pathway predicted ATPase ExeA
MDPSHNPFSPGAGTPPPELAGRRELLNKAMLALARVKRGRSEKSILLVGLRGTGKTVLLREIASLAKKEHYQVAQVEAQEKKSLPALLVPELRQILFALDRGERTSALVKRALGVFGSFISAFKVGIPGGSELTLQLKPELGAADSGDLDADLAHLFVALGEAAKDRGTAVAIIIDELQYLRKEELGALIMAAHKVSQEALPIIIFGAGLPQLVGKAGRAKSYAERLFEYPELGKLKKEDAALALQKPVEREGVAFTEEALQEIIRVTEGYPYFLQEWGSHAWDLAAHSPIDLAVAKKATQASIKKLDESFFRVRFDRLTPREKNYLRALAELGSNPKRSGDIASKLKIEVTDAAPLRDGLIKKGMIYSPDHGKTAFTVPLFGDFMKRVMPDFTL